MSDFQLRVPKQRNFAAKEANTERHRLSMSFGPKPVARRAVTELPQKASNDLQTDLRRSLRYNIDLSSAVASYVPGSLDLEDIPSVPVYNRNTGKFRVFSSPSSLRYSWSLKNSSDFRDSVGARSLSSLSAYEDAVPAFEKSLPEEPKAFKKGTKFDTFVPEFTNSRGLSPGVADIYDLYSMELPPGSDQNVNSKIEFEAAQLQNRELPLLPKMAKTDTRSSGNRSEVFSSGSRLNESSLEPEITPNTPRKLDIQPDDVHGDFLRHVPRRSVSTISTCQTVELSYIEQVYRGYTSVGAESVASEGSLWEYPAELTVVNDTGSSTETDLYLEESVTAINSGETTPSGETAPNWANSSSVYSSLPSLQRPPLSNRILSAPTVSKQLPPTPPATTPSPGLELFRNSLQTLSKSPKNVDFCLDTGADYDKSRFMIPKEYVPRPKKNVQRTQKRVVSLPTPPPKPVLKVKIHTQPRPVSAVTQPVQESKAPVYKRFSLHLPFRTNVKIRGPN